MEQLITSMVARYCTVNSTDIFLQCTHIPNQVDKLSMCLDKCVPCSVPLIMHNIMLIWINIS